MMWQQGPAGAIALLQNPNAPLARNQLNNLVAGTNPRNAGEFIQSWDARYNGVQPAGNAETGNNAPAAANKGPSDYLQGFQNAPQAQPDSYAGWDNPVQAALADARKQPQGYAGFQDDNQPLMGQDAPGIVPSPQPQQMSSQAAQQQLAARMQAAQAATTAET